MQTANSLKKHEWTHLLTGYCYISVYAAVDFKNWLQSAKLNAGQQVNLTRKHWTSETVLLTCAHCLSFLPCSSPTGARQTLQNPEKAGKVSACPSPPLHRLMKPEVKDIKWGLCRFPSTSAAVAGGLFAQRLRASGHSGGDLAGVAGGDAPSLHPVLRLGEAMWRLLRWWGPGVCSFAHAHTHHGGKHADTHTHTKFSL